MFEYITKTAIVRIHDGERNEADRRAAMEKAVKTFAISIQKSKAVQISYV